MQMKFSEIMDMIKRGELHYNQSTQRKFVYNSMDAIVSTNSIKGFHGIIFRKKKQNS